MPRGAAHIHAPVVLSQMILLRAPSPNKNSSDLVHLKTCVASSTWSCSRRRAPRACRVGTIQPQGSSYARPVSSLSRAMVEKRFQRYKSRAKINAEMRFWDEFVGAASLAIGGCKVPI